MNYCTPATMLCATGNRPLYMHIQPYLEGELLDGGLPSHPLDAPAFGPAGGCYKYHDRPLHGIVLYAGRMG